MRCAFGRLERTNAFSTQAPARACILFRAAHIIYFMAGVSTNKRPLALRALVVLGALLSLCVSDSVGPRLLPLPAASERTPVQGQAYEFADASSAPTREHPAIVRVAMAAPARKQAHDVQHTQHVTASAAQSLIKPTNDARSFTQTTYSPVQATPVAVRRPSGRAPPPSI